MASVGKRKAPMPIATSSSEHAAGARATSKRTRFDLQAGNDNEGDLDIEEQDRKRNQQGRKGRVVTDGYDSEEEDEVIGIGSDSDEEGVERGDDRDANGKDEVEDMFNLDDDEGSPKTSSTKKGGGKKYLKMDDIEGQEFSEYESDENEDAEYGLESDEDEEDGQVENEQKTADPDAVVKPLKKGKKLAQGLKRKPKDGIQREDSPDMGFQMERFNMKNEMATGRFDEEGNYIENAKDPHAEHDKWLAGNYSRKTISAAREAQLKRERQSNERESQRESAKLDEDECKMRLAELLKRGETVLEALQRLGAQVKKADKSKKHVRAENVKDNSEGKSTRAELDQLTTISSELMSRFGRVNIYDVTYEELLRDVRRSGLVRATWDPAAVYDSKEEAKEEGRLYLYKWSPAYLAATSSQERTKEQEQEQFGPFSLEDLQTWRQAGYFGESAERIVLRANDQPLDGPWRSWEEVIH